MKDIWQLVVFGGIGAVLFLPLVVSESMFFPFITGKNFGFRIIVEITLAAWILLALYDPRYRPRFSWLLPGLGALLVVMFLANFFGEYAPKSFWSNYERMDGYVTLVHFAAYFFVLGSVLSHRTVTLFGAQMSTWYAFMVTALVAAVATSFTAFQQLAGITETTMGWRINGSLGNAAYMAIYMLFNVFVALWVALHSKQRWLQVVAAALAAVFVFLLVQTATRGTILGLAGGTFLGALYIAVFNTQFPKVRKVAVGLVLTVVVLVGALTVFRESSVVQDNLILQRATAINLTELNLRMEIWEMGLEGVAERPILGWGQGNFNYIFNEYYNPSIGGRSEEWYDRAHNIFVDWLATGGVLGLVAYLSIWVAAAYYVLIVPHRKRDETPIFSVTERGLLLGIFAGYFIHNLVVFDNIVSYIFFAIILALVHSKVTEAKTGWPAAKIETGVITNVVTPIVLVIIALTVYMVNVPSMQAAADIIDAYRSSDPNERYEAFERAFARDGFALQEVTEQFVQQALTIGSNQQIPEEIRQKFLGRADERIQALIAERPTDARVYVFATSFYRNTNQLDRAREYAALAQQYSPEKPSIIREQGIVEYQAGDLAAMREFMQQAYDLNPDNRDAQIANAAAYIATGAPEEDWRGMLTAPAVEDLFLRDQFVLVAANRAQNYPLLEEIFADR
ncbi:MAG TPA: O-antigen ligase family protein, partial [Candidatus Paceibacterota bacterium]|nr:O-antigen ligase family protein [Candidatus Paceibacterota bacterium]